MIDLEFTTGMELCHIAGDTNRILVLKSITYDTDGEKILTISIDTKRRRISTIFTYEKGWNNVWHERKVPFRNTEYLYMNYVYQSRHPIR